MSGTDDLFPDATAHPAAAVPPAVPVTPPAAPGAVVAPAAAVRRRGVGVAAFVLGPLALLGDLVGIIIAFATFASAITNIGTELDNVDDSLGALLGVIIVEFIIFFGGIVFGLLAVILGIVAAVRNRGRVLGVFGVIFGLVVLISHVVLLVAVTTSGNVPGVTS
ncbi:MAG TPA: hypothetical protein VGM70_11160 [Pseudolysinimonas sp.]|jgi:hypothetical protein